MLFSLRLALLLLLPASGLFAQTDQGLPRYLSAEEKAQILLKPPVACPPAGRTNPPPGPVRAMAEWEELQALLITWQGQSAILAEIVRAARKECRVIISCKDQNTLNSASSYLLSKNVDIASNVEFLLAPNNSIWVRDYGPNCVYANKVDSLYFVDWRYNRLTRPSDDTIATSVSKYMNVPLYTTFEAPNDLVNTGGNFMSDGLGTAFASRLILSENAKGNPYGVSTKTEGQIDTILDTYMGIKRYIKMTTLPYDAIHHIDMHMKLLDEETLLVGKYPDGVADGPQIEANLQYVLSNFTSPFGTPYKVIRIPMPPEYDQYPDNGGDYRTYANAVFVNKTVIVPFYEPQYDTTAQRVWQEALPGYTVVGINCNSIIPSLGAIHCITKEIGVNDPLHIVHQQLPCMDNANFPYYPVWATLEHRSGIASAKIHYTTDLSAGWKTADLPPSLIDTNWTHQGLIPQQPAGSTVYYYIEATAVNGKTISRPLPAPQGFWKFCVTESVGAPEVPAADLAAIYPNPASAITVIPLRTAGPMTVRIRLFNAFGQFVAPVFEGNVPAGDSNYFLDAAQYPSGAYWVELRTNNQVRVQKLIIR